MNVRGIILPAVALILVLGTGIVHGVMSGRWGRPDDLRAVASRLDSVPMTVGDWSATPSEIPDDQLARGEIVSYLSRRYVNRSRGTAVTVLVVMGRPGPISIHTPDVCFRGAGFELERPVTNQSADIAGVGRCEFMVGDFTRPTAATPEHARVFWGWSSDGRWTAPSNPRFEFAGKPFLFKLYVLRSGQSQSELTDNNECMGFLNQFAPAFQKAVSAASEELAGK